METESVVGDAQSDALILQLKLYQNHMGCGVLRYVRKRLEVDAQNRVLDGRRGLRKCLVSVDLRCYAGAGFKRARVRTILCQRRRIRETLVEIEFHRCRQATADQRQLGDQSGQVLTDDVVQLAREPAPFGVVQLDQPA